jgi:hypothetical protein
LPEPEPTASQKVAETHDTPLSWPAPEGRVWFVQVVPSQPSDTPPAKKPYPTASQEVVETHDTPVRLLTPEGREAVSFTQVEPPSVVS